MKLTRRTFIMACSASAAWLASTCQGCTQWCAIQIFVNEGRAVPVSSNPLSKTNHG